MTDKSPLVTVIIATWNRKSMVVRCVDSVFKNTYKNIELIVIDNASKDGTDRALKKYSRLKNFKFLKDKKEVLKAFAVNKALKYAHGELIFVLDDDNMADKNCIAEMVYSFKKHPDAGIVGPVAFYYSAPNIIMHAGTRKSAFMRRAIYPHFNERWKNQIKEGEEVDDFANAFMLKKECLEKAGTWDLEVAAMGEDGDVETRIRSFGYKAIINPKAKTYHDIPYDPSKGYFLRFGDIQMYNGIRSKIISESRYDTTLSKITFAVSIPLYVAYYVYRISTSNTALTKKLHLTRLVFAGMLSGISVGISGKNKIQRL